MSYFLPVGPLLYHQPQLSHTLWRRALISHACLRIQASLRSHYRPPMTQSAAARACVGARSRTGPLLDNTNENVAGRQVDGERMEYLNDITHGE